MGFFILIVVLIAALIARRFWKRHSSGPHRRNRFAFFFSAEDAVSQAFLLLSVFFLGITLLAFNREAGDPFSWRTVLLMASIAAIAIAYSLKAVSLLGFGLVGVAAWWSTQAVHWISGNEARYASLIAGIFFIALIYYVLGRMHGGSPAFKRYGVFYSLIGILTVTAFLFFFSTKPGLEALEEMTEGHASLASPQIVFSLCALAAALIALLIGAMLMKVISPGEAIAIVLLGLLFGEIALLPQQNCFINPGRFPSVFSPGNRLSGTGIAWAVTFNVLVFLELLGLLFSGYARKEKWLINLGAMFLFLLALVKYCDWFFTSLDKSIFFIGSGVLLLAVGWFMERGRRRLLSGIARDTAPALGSNEKRATD